MNEPRENAATSEDHPHGEPVGASESFESSANEPAAEADSVQVKPAHAEPVAESDADGDAHAEPSKRLSKRRGSGGSTTSTLLSGGVATSRALVVPAAAKKGKADADEEPAFDPATDLPMYREGMDWFVLRVASNKESYVRDTLLRKVQIEGMEDLVGRIMVPTEKTTTLKGKKPKVTETKLYPGYVFVEMKLEPDGRIPQDVFFLIKETTGVGDFVGTAGRPTPMATHEVEKMLFDSRRPDDAPTVRMDFAKGDSVTINEGPFQSFQGTVDEVLPERGLVRVLVTIFGRQAPVELEYWQISRAEE